MDKLYNFVIYHKNCNDGFASAWIAWNYLKDKVKHIFWYPSTPDASFIPNFENKDVLVLDLTFVNKKLMDNLRNNTNKLFIIDHHKQAHSVLKDSDKYIHNDDNSAAVLTWEYFYPDKPVPTFIKIIQDEDIKGNKFDYTKYFASALPLLYQHDNKKFELWNELLKKENIIKVIKMGKNNKLFKEDLIRRNLHGAIMKFEGHKVIVHNFVAVGLWNDIANMLASKYIKTTEFCMLWAYEHAKKRYSVRLRSLKDTVDLNKIALKYGGGGHGRAAAFYHKNVHELLQDI